MKSFKEFLQLAVEKIPYFVLSAAAAILMLSNAYNMKALVKFDQFPMGSRIIASGNAVFEYVRLQLLPFDISPLHIIPSPIPAAYTVKTILIILVTVVILVLRKKYSWLTAAWCCFVIALVPILAVFQANPMSFAAHCTYLPSVFPGIIVAATLAEAYNKYAASFPYHKAAAILAASLLIFYGAMTQFHIGVWKDSETLWTRVIEIQPFDRPYFTRALHYVDVGRYQEAIDDYSVCLKFMTDDNNPDSFNLHAFRGEALAKAGRYEEAVRDFTAAIEAYPHQLYYYHRGMALREMGRAGEAEADLQRAGNARGQMFWFTKQ
jgi:tetratricopeptide (TPR) repeat protein